MKEYKILDIAKEYAVNYLDELPRKRAFPTEETIKELEKFIGPIT